MCRRATVRIALAAFLAALPAFAQTAPNPASTWRRVGNTVVDAGLASPAGGPVERVWFSPDGSTILARLRSGVTYRTTDLEKWSLVENGEPPPRDTSGNGQPEAGALTASAASLQTRVYGAGADAWRSDDGGGSWSNLTRFQGQSILGGALTDIAVSPTNPDEIVVAGENGVWRSVDGGGSWLGLNSGLPNFPGRRLLAVPAENPNVRVATQSGLELTWTLGERAAWRVAPAATLPAEAAQKAAASAAVGVEATAVARAQDLMYAGSADGRLFTSSDRGRTWRPYAALPGAGRVIEIITDSRDPLFALAVTNSRQRARVLRTLNGGVLWDDITGDLPAGSANGVAADRLTGAVYVATSAGVFLTYTDTVAASPATPWTSIRPGPAADVMVDPYGNQLYVLAEGVGVFAALAPHRLRDPRVVSAGDRVLRAAAPGSLLSVLGAKIESARAGELTAPVLDARENESQVQLPFDLTGTGVLVSMNSSSGRLQIGLPVAPTSPSIFVDPEGSPLILNAETGLMLDAGTPARSNARIQILASGLGQVTPPWPTGLAAPLQDPPRVVAPVRAYLDREVLEVTRATLAPGYVGLYLVEVRLPALVNRGTAELYIEAGEGTSNRVRIFVEP